MTALTASGGAIFAGAADGGVWKSTDRGGHWRFWSTGLPRLSIGALATNPRDGSVWVGLGEANTTFDSFAALRRLPHRRGAATCGTASAGRPSRAAPSTRCTSIRRGHVYAATSAGLLRHSASPGGPWHAGPEAGPEPAELALSHVAHHRRDVPAGHRWACRPGGARLARADAAPSDLAFNGFYVSKALGQGGHVPSHHADRRHRRARHRPDDVRRKRRAHLRDHRIAGEAREPDGRRGVHEPAGHLRLEEREPGRSVDADR